MSAPFSGLTVLEYADFIAGPYCGKLLADMGARVIKIEPPSHGDSARGYGPFPADTPDREKSGLFLYLNLNKQSVTLDPATATGRELFVKLASRADVLLEDTTPGCMHELDLGYGPPTGGKPGPDLRLYLGLRPGRAEGRLESLSPQQLSFLRRRIYLARRRVT